MKDPPVQIDANVIQPPVNEKGHHIKVFRSRDLLKIAALPLLTESLAHGSMIERCVLAELYIQVFTIHITHKPPAVQVWKLAAIRGMPDHQIIIKFSHATYLSPGAL